MEYCKSCNYETPRTDNMAWHCKTKLHQYNFEKWKLMVEGATWIQQKHFGNLEILYNKYEDYKMKNVRQCIDDKTIENSKHELRLKLAKVQYKNSYEHRRVNCDCGGTYSDIPTTKNKHLQTLKHKTWEEKQK